MQILISMPPEQIEKMINGDKLFEYRKFIPKEHINTVIVYATAPVCKIVGEFSVKQTLVDTLENLWNKTKYNAGITKEEFEQYFQGKTTAYAFEIEEFYEYIEKSNLKELIPSGKPPQNFYYLM